MNRRAETHMATNPAARDAPAAKADALRILSVYLETVRTELVSRCDQDQHPEINDSVAVGIGQYKPGGDFKVDD